MWSIRRIVELFGIEHPIVLAPMAGLSTAELAAEVSNAGGLGSIGCAITAPELIAMSVVELQMDPDCGPRWHGGRATACRDHGGRVDAGDRMPAEPH